MPRKAVDPSHFPLQLFILGYLNESILHEEFEYEIVILIQRNSDISVFDDGGGGGVVDIYHIFKTSNSSPLLFASSTLYYELRC